MGIITTNKDIAEDAINFFNYLSGYSTKPEYNKLIVAPYDIQTSSLIVSIKRYVVIYNMVMVKL